MKNRPLLANPFARALAAKPEPDDVKATSPGVYVVFGLLSMVLAALLVAALVLPPLFTYSLIVRGVRAGRPGMVAAGGVMALLYFFLFARLGRRLMGRPRPPAEPPAPPPP